MSKKKIILIGAGILLVLPFIFSSNTSQPTTIVEQVVVTATPEPQPTANYLQTTYMEGCMESGEVSNEYCLCTYQALRRDKSLSEISEFASATQDEIMEIMLPYAIECYEYTQ